MAGLGRMDEEGRGAGRGERGGDLAGDMAALADAGDDDAAGGGADELDGAGEGRGEPVVERREQGVEPGALGLDRAQRRGGGLAAGSDSRFAAWVSALTAMSRSRSFPLEAPV